MIGQRDTVNGAHFGFTDRWGGVSAVPYEELNLGGAVGDDPGAVTANRELAAKSLGVDPARVVWMNQVHGADVAVVDAPWGDRPVPRVDAVVTAERGLALAGVHPGVGGPLLVPTRPHHRAARGLCVAGLMGHDGP